jgi:hypothetical protein
MTTLDERERAFEAMFAHDEEMRFRVEARRAKLLAAWACERMGLFGPEADNYAQSFMTSMVAGRGIACLAEKVRETWGPPERLRISQQSSPPWQRSQREPQPRSAPRLTSEPRASKI